MAHNDSSDPWIDFLVTDPFSEDSGTARTAEVDAARAAGARTDAPEGRLELELVYVRPMRREVPLAALELPYPELPELPDTEGRLRQRRKRRSVPEWLVRECEDETTH